MNKKYYPEIDICRGIGIILVVLGHAFKQTGETNTVFEVLLSFIYSFHMPLFFLVSGFVAVKILDFQAGKERIEFIKGRVLRLLVPYFAVGLFYMPIKFVLSRFAVKPYDFSSAWKILLGENPNTVLWFLYTLFWVSVISAYVVRRRNFPAIFGFSGGAALIAYMYDTPVQFAKYWFFFLAGIYLRDNYEKMRNVWKSRSFLAAVVFFGGNVLLYVTHWSVWTFITAVSGCVCTLVLSQKIAEKKGLIYQITELCGKYSMDIYILSDLIATAFRILFWGILGWNYLLCTLICFIVSMFLPIPVSKYIIKKVKVFRLLVLGMK